MLFFRFLVLGIVSLRSSSESAMASPPSRAAFHPRSVVALLNRVEVFALSSAFDWCRLRVIWWSKTAKPELSGEPWRSAMAATGRRWRRRPRLSLSFIGNDTSRPRLDQGLRLEDTLSAVIFAKEPLTFIILEPAVLSAIS
jgi:hypothetical protein